MIALRKLVSAAAAASLLATGTIAGVAAVNPSGQVLPTAAAQADSYAIPQFGKLHVHKRIGVPVENLDNDGTDVTDSVTGEPAPDITYEAHRVADLDTLADYQGADGLTVEEALARIDAETAEPHTATTGLDGIARFDPLARGLYLVIEEDDPMTTGGRAVAPTAPFLVAVPLTDPDSRSGWLETVNVYPKGQSVESVTKAVIDPDPATPGSSVGDTIGYEIATTIPAGTTLSGFTVTDKLPAEFSYGAVSVSFDGEPADLGTHYTEEILPRDGDGDVVIVRLSEQGLGMAASDSVNMVVTITGTVAETPPNGTLDNQAWVSPVNIAAPADWDPASDSASPNPGTASNLARSLYGEIGITTSDAVSAEQLGGSTFELHRCTPVDAARGDLVADSGPIAVGSPTEAEGDRPAAWTTSADNVVTISGIHLANLHVQAGAEDTTPAFSDVWGADTEFCLVETQATDGYELLPEPFLVTLDYAEGPFSNVTTPVQATVNINKARANLGAQLPLTGGIGIWLVLGIGAALLLAAAAYYLANRKRDA